MLSGLSGLFQEKSCRLPDRDTIWESEAEKFPQNSVPVINLNFAVRVHLELTGMFTSPLEEAQMGALTRLVA